MNTDKQFIPACYVTCDTPENATVAVIGSTLFFPTESGDWCSLSVDNEIVSTGDMVARGAEFCMPDNNPEHYH